MIGVQNLNYYFNFFSSAQDVKKRHQQTGILRTLMSPLDRVTRVASSIFTDYVLLPVVKTTHTGLGTVATKATALVSTQLSNWVEKSWNDPISTRTLLKIGEGIESATKAKAKSTPTEWPVFEAVDKCLIGIARHLYVIAKDFNSLLRIPNNLRDYVNWTTVDTSPDGEAEPSTIAQKGWALFQKGTKLVSNALMALIAKVIAVASLPLEKIPYLELAVTWIGQKIDAARNHIHKSLIKKAHDVIDTQEAEIRKSIMGKIGEISTRTLVNEVLNLGIKFYISKEVYQLGKLGFAQVIGSQEIPETVEAVASAALKIAAFTLFMRSIAPSIERLHDDYKQDFDTEASTFREFGSLVNRHNLPKLLSFIKKHFTKTQS